MEDKQKKDILKDDEITEDAVVEEIEAADDEQKEPDCQQLLNAALEERDAFKDKWLRAEAEMQNFRKRNAVEKARWIKNANQRIVLEICDVNDNFERALQTELNDKNQKDYQKGISLIQKQIDNILKKEGVKKIECDKKEFNPEIHEAIAHIPSDMDENMIAGVIQNGYTMNGVVIRAARVAVANGEKPVTPKKKKSKNKK